MKPALIALVGVLIIAGLAPRGASAAPDLSARDIMEKNFFVTKPKTLKSDLTMILVNDNGQTRERKSTTLSKLQSNGVDSKLLVRFDTPADIKGTGFLQIEHSDADDDLWIYFGTPCCAWKPWAVTSAMSSSRYRGTTLSNATVATAKKSPG